MPNSGHDWMAGGSCLSLGNLYLLVIHRFSLLVVLNLDVEMNSRSDEVNVLLNIFGKRVLFACYVCLAGFFVGVLVVLGFQKLLRLGNGHVGVDPVQTLGLLDSLGDDAGVG